MVILALVMRLVIEVMDGRVPPNPPYATFHGRPDELRVPPVQLLIGALVTLPMAALSVLVVVLLVNEPSSVTLHLMVLSAASKVIGIQDSLKPLSELVNSNLFAEARPAAIAQLAMAAVRVQRSMLRVRMVRSFRIVHGVGRDGLSR
jgi:hypothetical protein